MEKVCHDCGERIQVGFDVCVVYRERYYHIACWNNRHPETRMTARWKRVIGQSHLD